jgi:polyhydroxybutyrate depolymerase
MQEGAPSQNGQLSPSQGVRNGGDSGLQTGSVTSGGMTRNYFIFVPSSYRAGQAVPLVLGFHGGGIGSGKGFARTTSFNQLAEQEKFIVVYPSGIDGQWNDGRGTPKLHPDISDVDFVSALLDQVEKDYSIDSRRIYATGISNGGFFTQRLACELSNRIAAFAPVAASMAAPLSKTCNPPKPVSILMINSPDDQFIPWKGGQMTKGAGGQILSIANAVQFWQKHNGCRANPQEKTLTPLDQADPTQVTLQSYTGCRNGSEVLLYTIQGGGHTWPNGDRQPKFLLGVTSRNLTATNTVWNFFKRHSL